LKRYGGLAEAFCSFENLFVAARKAQRGKRDRPSVGRFNHRLEWELLRMQRELEAETYQFGRFFEFRITDPKPRLISAAPYRDRVAHHAFCNVVEPVLNRGFISDSYSCRVGKGTHRAVDRFTQYARRYRYVLRADISKYFPSIDHDVLLSLIRRKIKDRKLLWFAESVVRHSNPQDPALHYFPGDHLFTPYERRRGIPIGNLTSQLFANLYLDPLDHFVKEVLRSPGYVRYTDDLALFSDDKGWLWWAAEEMTSFLQRFRLILHKRKLYVQPTRVGTDFLGYQVFPDHRRLRRCNGVRFQRRLGELQRQYACYEVDLENVHASVQSWIAHASHADTHGLRTAVLAETVFQRGATSGAGKNCGAARSTTTIPTTSPSRIATTTIRRTATTTTGFVA